MTIGENIKKVRKARKLTQKQLANLINKTDRTIQKYEKNDIEPPISVINDIAEALMVSTSDLIPVNNDDINRWDKDITPQLYLSQIPTDQLIQELNNRDDFPIKLEIKE